MAGGVFWDGTSSVGEVFPMPAHVLQEAVEQPSSSFEVCERVGQGVVVG